MLKKTPLVEFSNIENAENLQLKILAKLEAYNTWGSSKDRIAVQMINDAQASGKISKDYTIIEPTSGNTGIALAAVCKNLGMHCIIVMPNNMSKQRIDLIASYGAKVVLTPAELGMQGSIEKANKLHNNISLSWIPAQFDNSSNWKAHFNTTGPEIWEQCGGNIDAFVAGVGTGGTITGVGKFLKEKKPSIKIFAVEPSNSAVLSGKNPGMHKIQGIGAGFIPKVLDMNVVDEVITVTDEEALFYFDWINNKENHSSGISSGAVLSAAIKIAKSDFTGNTIVILCSDGLDRYK